MQLVFSTLLTALFTASLVTATIPQSSTEANANDALAPRFPPTLKNSEHRAKPPVFLTHRSIFRDIDYLQELAHRDIIAPNEGEPQQHTDTGLDPEKEAVLRQVLMGFEADLSRIQDVI
ncbi:hypothetical protein CF319_g8596, partial [Tilletia indica]